MTNKKVETLLTKIKTIKNELESVGEMRPGSLSQQFNKRGGKSWPFWQLSYTYKKSRSQYIRDEFVDQIKSEIEEYKKFKKLMDNWIKFSIELSQEKIKIRKKEMETEKYKEY